MQLSTTTWGDGPLSALLLHGIGSNKEGWWRVGPAVADLGYTVTAVDLRGHGHSQKADRYLLDDFTADLSSLGTWDLVLGHSLGGAIAVTLVAAHPGCAAALILEDPALFLPDPGITLPMLLSEYEQPLTLEAQAKLNPTWHLEDTRIKTEALSQCGPEVFERIIGDNGSWNLIEGTAGLPVPTLIVGAGIDPVTPPALGEGLAALADRITFVQVPGSSHSIHRDEFEPLMDVIRSWLG